MYRIDGKCSFKDCKPTLINSRQTYNQNKHANITIGIDLAKNFDGWLGSVAGNSNRVFATVADC